MTDQKTLFETLRDDGPEALFRLIDDGVDINQQASHGGTALHYAVSHGMRDVAVELISRGADVNPHGFRGWTPLHSAVNWKSSEKCKLYASGADFHEIRKLFSPDKTSSGENAEPLFLKPLRAKCLEIVKLLISNGANVDARSDSGETPLHIASENGEEEIVSLLIKNGANPHEKDRFGRTPLARAAFKYNGKIIKMLIENGADANTYSDNKHETPVLCIIAGKADKEIINLFISKGANVNAEDSGGNRPLDNAAAKGNTEIVQMLIDNGADVNACNRGNSTALHSAVRFGHKEIVRILIDNGANLDIKDSNYGDSALHDAALHEHREIMNMLLEHGANPNSLNRTLSTPLDIILSRKKDEELAKMLREKGGYSWYDDQGDLASAVRIDMIDKAEERIKSGADINARMDNGNTPLFLCRSGEMTAILIAAGADIKARNDFGDTPLHIAARWGITDSAKVLIKHEADIEAKDNSGSTPLFYAAFNDQIDTVSLLVDSGADTESGSGDGGTPLLAASRWKGKSVKILLEKGANVNARGSHGATPLHNAAYSHNHINVELLIEYGAEINATDDNDYTPLKAALSHAGNDRTEELLRKHGGKTWKKLKEENNAE